MGINEDYRAGYRSREDACHWYDNDPVSFQRCRLLEAGVSQEELAALEREVDEAIAKSARTAEVSGLPSTRELYKDVHA